MNIGFLIGFAISGYFELNANYSRLFLISSFSNFIAILIVLFRWKFIKDKKTHFISLPNMKKNVFRFFSILIFAAIIFSMRWLINNPTLSNNMIIIAGIVMFFVVLYLVFKQPTKLAAERIWAYLILGIMSLVFWSLYMMAPMGLTLFIKNNVIRSFHGFTIAPQWVLNINSIIIIIGGPLMAYIYKHLRKKGFNISIPAQFTLALFLIGLAFIILPIGISLSDSKGMVNFGWVALSYILQSIGELCISPIGYAMIGQLIPEKLQGTLMGTWMMLTGLAAVIANIFSKMAVGTTNQIAPLTTNPTYFKTFNILGISAIVAGIIMLCLISFLQKLIKEKKHPTDSSAVPR